MALFDFVNAYLLRKKGVKEYQETLARFLSDGTLLDEEKKELEEIRSRFGLMEEDISKLQKISASNFFQQISSDHRITEDEKKSLEAILTYFGLETKDFAFDQQAFNAYYTLAMIENGILPTITKEHHDLNLIFKEGEVLHYAQRAVLRKLKRITTRINYGGFTGSIKITRGVRYRTGSIRVGAETQEIFTPDDTGGFYLTNQRVGFLGSRKQFALPYLKISSFELKAEGMYIFKEGKEAPYILTMNDYEVPLAIVSFILNK